MLGGRIRIIVLLKSFGKHLSGVKESCTYLIEKWAESDPFCSFFERNPYVDVHIFKIVVSLDNILLVLPRIANVPCQTSEK